MKAFMSKKLEKIINSPQGNKALQNAISKLQANNNKSTEIAIGKEKYKINFTPRKMKMAEEE